MPTIIAMIKDYESDILEMIAEYWGIAQDLDPQENIRERLSNRMGEAALFGEVLVTLSDDAREALADLSRQGGKISLTQFTHQHGSFRQLGYLQRKKIISGETRTSATEELVYKGLIGIAFFRGEMEAQEFVFLPDEFRVSMEKETKNLPLSALERKIATIDPATVQQIISAGEQLIEHGCTLLAGMRRGYERTYIQDYVPVCLEPFLFQLLRSNHTITSQGVIDKDLVKNLLTDHPSRVLHGLKDHWLASESVDELRLLPGLAFEGTWINHPVRTRQQVINILHGLPAGQWFGIEEAVDYFYQHHPDFQRSIGEFDTWMIKSTDTGIYMTGFDHWHAVEGRLIRYFLRCPLYWMQEVELGAKKGSNSMHCFRRIDTKEPASGEPTITGIVSVMKDGTIITPDDTAHQIRYQIARLCDWGPPRKNGYAYSISINTFRHLEREGLSPQTFAAFLREHSQQPHPPSIQKVLKNLDQGQNTATISPQVVLQAENQAIIRIINQNMKDYVVEQLNPTTLIVLKKGIKPIQKTLFENGFLLDFSSMYNQNTISN